MNTICKKNYYCYVGTAKSYKPNYILFRKNKSYHSYDVDTYSKCVEGYIKKLGRKINIIFFDDFKEYFLSVRETRKLKLIKISNIVKN